jgi:DNA invertase Pin-like site-specific DNA recombinase
MINHEFKPDRTYRYVMYARMSSDRQNPRSPDQQFEEIKSRIQRLGYPWVYINSFRDDGVSGRMIKRPGLDKMLAGIRSGQLKVDLVLLDTMERLGRNDELGSLIRDLRVNHGVLVLTADRSFADPTTPEGEFYNLFEATRAVGENRIKSYQVLRGKRDKVRRGFWTGGAPPFGYRLEYCIGNEQSRQVNNGSKLVVDPVEGPIVQKLFRRAIETHHGTVRLARWLNKLPEMPEQRKPVHEATVRYWLNQRIYTGSYVWEKHCTDIRNDARVIRANPECQWVQYSGFCDPLVSNEEFNSVQAIFASRRRQRAGTAKNQAGKLIQPLAGGISLVYPLSGLVVCGECGGHMRPMTSGRKSKAGNTYCYYSCSTSLTSDSCKNRTCVPERWLRQVVINQVRNRILGLDPINWPPDPREIGAGHGLSKDELASKAWYADLVRIITSEIEQDNGDQVAVITKLKQTHESHEHQLHGWTRTLADPDLPDEIRRHIYADYPVVQEKARDIAIQIQKLESCVSSYENLISPDEVHRKMQQLADVLEGENASRLNIELSQHIDRIECLADGQIRLRLCRLGLAPALADIVNLDFPEEATDFEEQQTIITPRKRTRRQIITGEPPTEELKQLTSWSTDPGRYSHLPPKFFEEHHFQIPVKEHWYQKNKNAVAEKRKEGLNIEELAANFGCSVPTIRRTLDYAKQTDPELARLPVKRPRRRWHEDHVQEVLLLLQQGLGILKISEQLGKSEPTIRKAIEFASSQGMIAPITPRDQNAG